MRDSPPQSLPPRRSEAPHSLGLFPLSQAVIVLFVLSLLTTSIHAEPPSGTVKVKLQDADERVEVRQTPDGEHRFILHTPTGEQALTPEQFAGRVYVEQTTRSWLEVLLNITSPIGIIWVVVGLGGQVLFTGRMLVQWLISEREKRSVVPPIFWWMSLTGASMLIVYFVWRKDIVGILGQATGWGIYIRNLWLIYHPRPAPDLTADPAPEPATEP